MGLKTVTETTNPKLLVDVSVCTKVSKLQTKTMNALIVIDVHAKESDSFLTTQAVATVTSMDLA